MQTHDSDVVPTQVFISGKIGKIPQTIIGVILGLLAFCSSHAEEQTLTVAGILMRIDANSDAERYLNQRYARDWSDCTPLALLKGYNNGLFGNISDTDQAVSELAREPLYKCTGLIIRGTRREMPAGQNAFDPYPAGRTDDTSFSYVRVDIKMKRLAWAYSNGFIIAAPENLNVNCFYPLDAKSDQRLDKGCGTYKNAPEFDAACPENAQMSDNIPDTRRCRYDLRRADPVEQFRRGVVAASWASRHSDKPNDLKIETWKAGYDPRLPIIAFMYVNNDGKAYAERDRAAYEKVSGKRVPVVLMTFPESDSAPITFKVVD